MGVRVVSHRESLRDRRQEDWDTLRCHPPATLFRSIIGHSRSAPFIVPFGIIASIYHCYASLFTTSTRMGYLLLGTRLTLPFGFRVGCYRQFIDQHRTKERSLHIVLCYDHSSHIILFLCALVFFLFFLTVVLVPCWGSSLSLLRHQPRFDSFLLAKVYSLLIVPRSLSNWHHRWSMEHHHLTRLCLIDWSLALFDAKPP